MASQAAMIIFLSIFIASVLSPLMNWLQKLKMPKFIALLIVLLLIIVLLFGVVYILNTSLKDFIGNLPFYEERLKNITVNGLKWLNGFGLGLEPKAVMESLNLGAVFNVTAATVGNIGVFVSKMMLVIIGVAFLLVEAQNFEKKVDIKETNNKGPLL